MDVPGKIKNVAGRARDLDNIFYYVHGTSQEPKCACWDVDLCIVCGGLQRDYSSLTLLFKANAELLIHRRILNVYNVLCEPKYV